jgi:hypothetical protein
VAGRLGLLLWITSGKPWTVGSGSVAV